jgi:DNA-binding NarL/FixJ family response regulator
LEGQSVASEAQHRVVILYQHALLGEGIAKFLRAQIGVQATLGCANDPKAVTAALASDPEVVIFESNDPFAQFDLTALVPHAVLIDVSTVITRGSALSPGVAGLEQILEAVRKGSSTVAPSNVVGVVVVDAGSEARSVGTSGSPVR